MIFDPNDEDAKAQFMLTYEQTIAELGQLMERVVPQDLTDEARARSGIAVACACAVVKELIIARGPLSLRMDMETVVKVLLQKAQADTGERGEDA